MNESTPTGDRKSGGFGHVPVLLHRAIDLLHPGIEALGDDVVVVDGALGAGGYTEYLLEQFPKLYVVGLDCDDSALRGVEGRLMRFGDRFVTFRVRFDSLAEVLSGEIPAVAGGSGTGNILARAAGEGIADALLDLDIPSMQLDQINRGFVYQVDAPLDMRVDASQGITAADVLNTYSHGDTMRILSTYGDERFVGKIASAILRERGKEPFTNSDRLVELLCETTPAISRRKGGYPAKRTFQALRIEVNRESEALENVLPQVCDALAVDGRIVFMSYQSLEDRIVKRDFMERVKSTTPPGLPMELPGHEPHFALIARGAEKASASEIEGNPRAALVRIRCIERIRAD